jgi:hypothetical protein
LKSETDALVGADKMYPEPALRVIVAVFTRFGPNTFVNVTVAELDPVGIVT